MALLKYRGRVLEERRRLAVLFEVGESRVTAELDAQAVDALAREFALQAALIGDGREVAVQFGRAFIRTDQATAASIARLLTQGKLKLDEIEQHERIALDGAILAKAGAPFTLSDHPKIKELVKTEAAHNRDLRRFMGVGIKSKELFGLPKLLQAPPQPRPLATDPESEQMRRMLP